MSRMRGRGALCLLVACCTLLAAPSLRGDGVSLRGLAESGKRLALGTPSGYLLFRDPDDLSYLIACAEISPESFLRELTRQERRFLRKHGHDEQQEKMTHVFRTELFRRVRPYNQDGPELLVRCLEQILTHPAWKDKVYVGWGGETLPDSMREEKGHLEPFVAYLVWAPQNESAKTALGDTYTQRILTALRNHPNAKKLALQPDLNGTPPLFMAIAYKDDPLTQALLSFYDTEELRELRGHDPTGQAEDTEISILECILLSENATAFDAFTKKVGRDWTNKKWWVDGRSPTKFYWEVTKKNSVPDFYQDALWRNWRESYYSRN